MLWEYNLSSAKCPSATFSNLKVSTTVIEFFKALPKSSTSKSIPLAIEGISRDQKYTIY